MKTQVTLLFKHGKRIPCDKPVKTKTGRLSMMHNQLGECSALLLDTEQNDLFPQLHHANVLSITRDGFTIRGAERIHSRETIQEWWCIPVII